MSKNDAVSIKELIERLDEIYKEMKTVEKFCRYVVENYTEIKEITDCNLIVAKRARGYEKKREIENSSYNVIKKFIEKFIKKFVINF